MLRGRLEQRKEIRNTILGARYRSTCLSCHLGSSIILESELLALALFLRCDVKYVFETTRPWHQHLQHSPRHLKHSTIILTNYSMQFKTCFTPNDHMPSSKI